MSNIGVIQEQGDLGLGFEELSNEDQDKVRKETSKENEDGAE